MSEKAAHKGEEDTLTKDIDSKILKRLLGFFKPYSRYIVFATFLTIIISALAALRPRLTPIAIDDKIMNNDAPGLQYIILIMLGTLVVQGIIQYGMTYLTSWIGQKIIYDLRKKIYSHILSLDLKFFDRNPIGRIVTRVTGDVEVLFEVFSSGLVTAFGDIFLIFWILYFMFSLDFTLTLVTLSVLPLLIYATSVFRKKVRESYRRIRLLIAKLNSYIQEHLTGITIVQYFVKEKKTIDEFEEINRDHTEQNKKSVLYYAVFFPIVELLSAISAGLIIWYGGGQVIQNAVSVGVLISFIQFTEMFFRPIRDLSEKYNILQTAMASSERIFALLDEKPTISDPEKPIELKDVKGNIEFRNVSFAYNEGDYVLRNINFKIKEGEKVAFVGATGAGKSTIINLLTRFYDVYEGEILLDGVNIKDIEQMELRKNIAIVLQDVFLFSGDIRSNITLNNPEITDEIIYNAIDNTGLRPFVDSHPETIYKQVTERGSSFSVGQKQLISFARALAYDPKILILDEATSSVDTNTEILIQNAIKKLIEGRTSIIIAHRLSTIQNCDKIIVMHKGEIKEMGTHQQLLEKGGLYFKLYQLQYKEEEISE
ncbi:MAG TPA: ABC transporter ATP-binding protein [Ignavibacteria bacterium]|nr:ABC transporter ATP-binding protein [Ignavibacteria bacterium]HQY51062.1 ABC transporter ATP-binding protein [Ignavibacteria bacterium]HRB00449.1 ABC transporter ATP-binding protein [Ignavibacteria bacterium]